MSTISHEPVAGVRRTPWIEARNMWVSLAIVAIWVSVLLTALFGPDIRSFDAGGNTTSVPSGVVVALVALFATRSMAKYGYESKARDN